MGTTRRQFGIVFDTLESRQLFSAAVGTGVEANDVAPAIVMPATATAAPRVTACSPSNGTTQVPREAFVSCDIAAPNGGIDAGTLTNATVYLTAPDGSKVAATLNTSGGGDVIVLKPKASLAASTKYVFTVTEGLKDLSGAAFKPFTVSFTTTSTAAAPDPTIKFDKAALPTTDGREYLGLQFGPDGKLYAGTTTGEIVRWAVKADGTLGEPQVITTIRDARHVDRFVVGLAFDPKSTADDLKLWVTHTGTSGLVAGEAEGKDWSGAVSLLSGPDLATIEGKVINLPRSVRDHLTNQATFGPDGALYFCQSSNSAMGAADAPWGNRPEHLLSATILRLDPKKLTGVLDAHTEDADPYDPFAPDAPLTIYADGVRNAYDLVFHSNGTLYAPANGSAAGGATPAGPGVPGIPNVATAETDYLFQIQPGKYYGHPNPTAGHYVLNGGNPTAGVDPFEVPQYPVGTMPDADWKPATYDFGVHQSPNGAIEYKSNAFGGKLKGKLLVARYSGGDDIIVLNPKADGSIGGAQVGNTGMTGFNNPVDLVENPATGDLYVIEFDGKKLTLLRPHDAAPAPEPTPEPEPTPKPIPEPPVDEPKDPPVVVPPPVVTPQPVPTVSAACQKLIVKIERYCQKAKLTVPAGLTGKDAAGLKQELAGLKLEAKRLGVVAKVQKLADRRGFETPDLATMAIAELKELMKVIKRAR